jgi:hypothetical protein
LRRANQRMAAMAATTRILRLFTDAKQPLLSHIAPRRTATRPQCA